MSSVKSPQIAMIAAMAKYRVIGADNAMPWHLPADLKHFKATTLGKPVIMGRKTYESIGKALPGRHNIVVSRQANYQLADADVVSSAEQALTLAVSVNKVIDEIMIIGGGALYEALLPRANKLYLTFIDLDVQGDTYFPDYDQQGGWNVLTKNAFNADDKNPYNYEFVCLTRSGSSTS